MLFDPLQTYHNLLIQQAQEFHRQSQIMEWQVQQERLRMASMAFMQPQQPQLQQPQIPQAGPWRILRKHKADRKPRTGFTSQQLDTLETKFKTSAYLSVTQRTELADLLTITDDQVKIWFQNRRAKDRRLKMAEEEQRMHIPSLYSRQFC
jgi:hypothetical protein